VCRHFFFIIPWHKKEEKGKKIEKTVGMVFFITRMDIFFRKI